MIYFYLALGLITGGGFLFGGINFAAGLFLIGTIIVLWLSVRDDPRIALGNPATTPNGVIELAVGNVLIVMLSWMLGGFAFGLAAMVAVISIELFLRTVPQAREFLDRLGNRPQSWLEDRASKIEKKRQKEMAKFDKQLARVRERGGV